MEHPYFKDEGNVIAIVIWSKEETDEGKEIKAGPSKLDLDETFQNLSNDEAFQRATEGLSEEDKLEIAKLAICHWIRQSTRKYGFGH